MMKKLTEYEVWFIAGSQNLYGEETLKNVDRHAQEIATGLHASKNIPVGVVYKGVVTGQSEISAVMREANVSENCIGVVTWMHTFSPAKMWIQGLQLLQKPLAHLHTQYNDEIPWNEIDMDFMNENQSAHGGREFGFMLTRMRKSRKVIVGHWKNEDIREELGSWTRAAAGWHTLQNLKIARIGDNMREVAVTEGDKVEVQMRFGFSVNGYGLGDLTTYIDQITQNEIDQLIDRYRDQYTIADGTLHNSGIEDAARIELGLRRFLESGGFEAFTDTFENLHGLKQLPGIAVQRLMADGYGFGAEGDWKTAALLRAAKVMEQGLKGGTSFMEDYTYDFRSGRSRVLGSHMLEICPSIAADKPRLEIHPLGIGGKEDPARLVFTSGPGAAVNASLVDMGNRFRLVINEVEAVVPENDLPNLPVARVLWDPRPNLKVAATSWILAGGAHHTVFSKSLPTEIFEDFAEMAGIECVIIDANTERRSFQQELRCNEMYYHLFENRL